MTRSILVKGGFDLNPSRLCSGWSCLNYSIPYLDVNDRPVFGSFHQ